MEYKIYVNELEEIAIDRKETVKYISTILCSYLVDKDYGDDVQDYHLIVILIKTRPGYEEWYKVRRPKYTNKLLIHEIRIDGNEFDYFISSGELNARKFFANKVIQSVNELVLPKKIKSFNKAKLVHDMQFILKQQKLL